MGEILTSSELEAAKQYGAIIGDVCFEHLKTAGVLERTFSGIIAGAGKGIKSTFGRIKAPKLKTSKVKRFKGKLLK